MLIESDYAGKLVDAVARMRDASRHVLEDLPLLLRADSLRWDDDRGDRVRRKMHRVRSEVEQTISQHAMESMVRDTGKQVSAYQGAELARQGRAALGIDLVTLDPRVPDMIAAFAHENVALIKKLEASTLGDLEVMITRAVADGVRAETLQEQIAQRWGIAERHARLIARDQIPKIHSRITEARHRELGLNRYKWRTMRDQRVRPRHEAREGKVFLYDEPPPGGHPGRDICCRCVQEAVFDDIYAELEALGV